MTNGDNKSKDVVFQIDHDAAKSKKFKSIRLRAKFRWAFGFKSNGLDRTLKGLIDVTPINSVLGLYLTVTTVQGDSRITY